MTLIIPKGNPTQASPGITVRLMTEQTVNETVSTVVCPSPGCKNHTFTLRVSAVVTGAVQIETSPDPTYTGLWSPLGGGPIDLATITAAGVLEIQYSNLVIVAARYRITTVVAGGNVSGDYTGGR